MIIQVGDLVLEELPAVLGPRQLSPVCCLGCCLPLRYADITWCSCAIDAFFPGQLNSISMFTVQVPRMQPAPLQSHLLWERKHPQVGNSDQCWTLQLEIGIGLGLWTGRRHQTISVCASCFHPDYFFCSLRFFHPGQSASFYRGRGTCWH